MRLETRTSPGRSTGALKTVTFIRLQPRYSVYSWQNLVDSLTASSSPGSRMSHIAKLLQKCLKETLLVRRSSWNVFLMWPASFLVLVSVTINNKMCGSSTAIISNMIVSLDYCWYFLPCPGRNHLGPSGWSGVYFSLHSRDWWFVIVFGVVLAVNIGFIRVLDIDLAVGTGLSMGANAGFRRVTRSGMDVATADLGAGVGAA